MCVYVCICMRWGVFGGALKKKNRVEQFAWDWCTAHHGSSRSNTIRLLKPCLSPLCVSYNGATSSSKHLLQIPQLHRWLLNTGFTEGSAFLACWNEHESVFACWTLSEITPPLSCPIRVGYFSSWTAEGHPVRYIYFVSSTLADPAASWLPRKLGSLVN